MTRVKPTGLLLFTLIMVSAVVGLFFAWPTYQEVQTVRAETQKRLQEYETREAYYRKLRDIKDRLDRRAAERRRLEEAIPGNPDLPALYGLLQTIASESGLVVKSVNSSLARTGETDGGAKRLTIDLKLTGSYASLKTFIERARVAPRFLNVQEIAFFSSRNATIPFDFSLLLNAYSY